MATSRYVPAAGWSWLTARYDRTVALTMREPAWRPRLVELAGAALPAGGTAVEVGCGTGTLAIALAEGRPDAHVVGVDGDASVLALAANKPGAERVRWQEGLATALPFGDGSVDVVLCSLLLHHLADEDKRAALGEVRRVLTPGGALVLADWGPPRRLVPALGARLLQVFDGRAGPAALLRGELAAFLDDAGLAAAGRRFTLPTVWGTLELWTARRLA